MEKIFYTTLGKYANSETAVKEVFKQFYGIENAKILRNEHGKPFLQAENTLHFSVSHTEDLLFIAVANENVGIDAEKLTRSVQYLSILRKFSENERKKIENSTDFFTNWTAKEAAIKWLGGTISNDLSKLELVGGRLFYNQKELPVICSRLILFNHTIAVCCKQDFHQAETIAF
jgi:phosphopantetheinyl transferase